MHWALRQASENSGARSETGPSNRNDENSGARSETGPSEHEKQRGSVGDRPERLDGYFQVSRSTRADGAGVRGPRRRIRLLALAADRLAIE